MRSARILKVVLVFAAVLVAGGLALSIIPFFTPRPVPSVLFDKTRAVFYTSLLDLFRNSIITLPFWGALVLTLTLRWWVPARPEQKLFNAGFAHDIVWFFYEAVLQTVVIVTYVALLTRVYGKYFSAFTLTSLADWPGWLRFVIALLAGDFLYWCQHVCNHKIRPLWRLHAVHHSQPELNFFTDFRYHVLEYVVRQTFLAIPFLIVQINVPTIVLAGILLRWYPRIYHGNIRTNLGPLRYILVTPQSHRIHHSIEHAHADKNFGAIFSIWDFAFGTQFRNYSVYPQTGIVDANFPHPRPRDLGAWLLSPLHQMVYSFRGGSGPRR